MNILTFLLIVLHIAVSLVLILVVLLQTGKRADLAGAFGGGGSQTAFGARGAATFLSKATTISAVLFMITSIWLGVRFGSESGSSVVQDTGTVPVSGAPALPAPTAPAPAPAGGIPVAPAPAPAQPAAPPAGNAQNPPPAQTPPAAPK
jgi:preprotein translocase subunit SecG